MRVSRLFAAVSVVLLVGAMLPAAALAGKAPAPSITGSCSAVQWSSTGRQWRLSGTFSWSGQPGGTQPGVTAVQVSHNTYYSSISPSSINWSPSPTDRTSGTGTLVVMIGEVDNGDYSVMAGDTAWVAMGFLNRKGVDKSEGFGFNCGLLPTLVP